MHIYLHSTNAEKSDRYVMTVAPAGDIGFVRGNDMLAEWKNLDGSPKQIEVIFKFGHAVVDDALGRYMTERGLAHKSRLLRRIARLFDRNGQPIEEAFDDNGKPVILGGAEVGAL